MTAVGIALGSNLGNSQQLIEDAIKLLASLSLSPIKQASIYRTKPIDCPAGSPDFLNTAIEISSDKSATELLASTQAIEQQLGRQKKSILNEPRPIDIDILYIGNTMMNEPQLILPHPRMLERLFVLDPLHEIAPDFILPHSDLSITQHREQLQQSLALPTRQLAQIS